MASLTKRPFPSAISEQVEERRSTFGLSYITVGVQDAENFAPVVQRLAGQ